jgi:hypothetical protein
VRHRPLSCDPVCTSVSVCCCTSVLLLSAHHVVAPEKLGGDIAAWRKRSVFSTRHGAPSGRSTSSLSATAASAKRRP